MGSNFSCGIARAKFRLGLFCMLAVVLVFAFSAQAEFYVVGAGKNYKNTLVVAKSGSPYTSVQDALDSISDAAEDNTYLIFVAPGTYTGRFTMKSWVDIVGSGPNVTILEAPGDAGFVVDSATGVGADNAALSDLTVLNTGGAAVAVAMCCSGTSPSLSDLHIRSENGTSTYGLYITGGSEMTVKDCTITAETTGTYVYGAGCSNSTVAFQNCAIESSGGTQSYAMFSSANTTTLTNCRVLASDASSKNHGLHNTGAGDITLHHCQVSATGSGSADQAGVYSTHLPTVRIHGGTVEASGGDTAKGIANQHDDTDSQIDALYAHNCSIRAYDASSSNIGVYSTGTTTSPTMNVYLNNCNIEAATNTVANGNYAYTYIGGCWLNGGDTDAGSEWTDMTCAGCWNEAYTFYTSTCP